MNFPKCSKIQIEVTNVCNYNCEMCPRLKLDVPLKHMPISIYRQVLKNINGVKYIDLTGWGEPLTNPKIFEMIRLAKKQGAKVCFTTNASLITKAVVDQLNQTGLDLLAISLDSVTDDSPGHLQSAITNNWLLLAKKNRNFEIKIQTTLVGQKISELEAITQLSSEIDATEFRLMRCDERFYPVRIDRINEKKVFDHLQKKWRGKLTVTMAQHTAFKGLHQTAYQIYRTLMPNHCPKVLSSAYINVDGFLTPCCLLSKHYIGDIKKESLSKLWRNKKFRQFRQNSRAICHNCAVLIK